MFKLVNPNNEDRASVCNDSQSYLSNNGKQKQVKATEIYLLDLLEIKHYQATGDQYRRETNKQFF